MGDVPVGTAMAAVKDQFSPGQIAADPDIVAGVFRHMQGKTAAGGALGKQGHRHIHQSALHAGQRCFFHHRHLLMDHGILPQPFHFLHGALAQPAVLHEHFPGRAHLSIPGMAAGRFLAGFPVVHPADHNAPPVGSKHRLRGIEVQAVIHGLDAFPNELSVLFKVPADDAHGAEARVKLFPGAHFLRADDQHLLAAQGEIIRTFPHAAVFLAAGVDLGYEMPIQPVLAFHQQHRA